MVPHTLYGMQETCNCQWLLWSPHTLYGMWEPCNCQWLLWSPHTSYGIGIWWSPTWTIWWSPHVCDMIFSGQLRKRSTTCPNNKAGKILWNGRYLQSYHYGNTKFYCIKANVPWLWRTTWGGRDIILMRNHKTCDIQQIPDHTSFNVDIQLRIGV